MPDEFEEVKQAEPGQPAVLVAEETKAESQTGSETKTESTETSSEEKVAEATTKAEEKPAAEETASGEKTPEKKSGIDKRFSELTSARKEAERIAAAEKARADEAVEALLRLGKEEKPKTKTDEDPKPEMPDFADPETFARDMATYTEQLTMWAARQAVKADRLESEKKRVQETNEQNTARVRSEFMARRKKALETFADYEEVAENPNLQISEVMASAIAVDAEGTAIAYYLGQHPEEAERISKFPPGQQLMEMGALRATILASRSAPSKKLPPPIKPQSGSAGVTRTLDDMDMDSYAAKRNAEIRGSAH